MELTRGASPPAGACRTGVGGSPPPAARIGRTAGLAVLVSLLAACGSSNSAPTTEAPFPINPAPTTTVLVANTPATTTVETRVPGSVDISTVPIDADMAPGEYHVELEGVGLLSFTVPVEGWRGWAGAYRPAAIDRLVAFTVGAPLTVVADPCGGEQWIDPGPAIDDFASALAGLPGMLVLQEPESVELAGLPAVHLTLQVPEIVHDPAKGFDGFTDCVGGKFYGWQGETGRPEGVLNRRYPAPAAVIDFWVVDAGGGRVLLETIRFAVSDPGDVADLDRIVGSVRIEP